MTTSKIEWTDRSDWNPVRGCTRVSPGCGGPGPHGGCYAEVLAGRFSDPGQWGHGFANRTPAGMRWTGKVELIEDRLTLPLRWRKPAPGKNKVFASSTSDIFHESLTDEDIDRIFAVMIQSPDWTFQVLTKRSGRMREYLSRHRWHKWAAIARELRDQFRHLRTPDIRGGDCCPVPNVWLGVSVEDQQRANERIPDLLGTPAAKRFLSCEPLLGSVDLSCIEPRDWKSPPRWWGIDMIDATNGWGLTFDEDSEVDETHTLPSIDQVIVGGESGPRCRDNDFLTNARSLRDQCRTAGVAFFGKQNVGKAALPDDLLIREFPA